MRPGIAQSLMKSTNFEFLRPRWPELASLAGFAEAYAHGDPVAAVVKLRVFGELIVQFIYDELRLPRPLKANLNDLLHEDAFQAAAPKVVVSKLHALRIHGNHAAHGEQITQKTSLWLLKEAFDLGRWLHLTFGNGALADCPDYREPPPGGVEAQSKKELQRERKAVLERLAAQEAQMQQLLADLEAAREQAQVAEASLAELRSAQEAALVAGTTAANVLDFDERETRRLLIDSLLAEAGWQIGADGASTAEVGIEVQIPHQSTGSGSGYADYVLYDVASGKPLAVIEAKKTSVDPEAGRTQAKRYADGLEKLTGFRPTIFYTNGYDLWIWDDAQQEPPRRIFGFHSKDSLQYRHFQRGAKQSLAAIGPSPEIAGRMYQIEAVRRVIERFAEKKRKALIVQATGTGKTRVAVSLCDALVRAKWARRILFLCDRRELRKQAHNVFKDYLPGEPRTIVTAETAKDRDNRIYLATYPAMMKCFETFDVGFFDLIIADESHRSIYNRYRDIFQYFDALQVGLTATPVDHIARSTYRIFDCEQDDPTVHYSYGDAIRHNPPYLVPFVVETHTTPFLREGIKYSQMTRQQRHQLDEEEPDPVSIEFDRDAVDKRVFNKDTNRLILRNLMERGIREATGTHVGKSIIFARNHNHAVLLQNLFDDMWWLLLPRH
jgi:type I restriction enzyme R subunit